MSIEIKVPELGESVVEATIGTWYKKPGEVVSAGELLVELETDKVDLEVEAEQDGVLSEILFEEGDDVEVGQVIALLDGNGAAPTAAADEEAEEEATEERARAAAEPAPNGDGAATPVARRLAREEGVDLAGVEGSGPRGRVTKEDVRTAVERRQAPATKGEPAAEKKAEKKPEPAREPQAPAARDGRQERVRMSRRRRTIARRLVEAQQNAAMLTTFNEVDMSRVMELRGRRKASFKERTGESLSISAFFIKAVVGALKAFPRLNAEIDGDEMVLKHYYDIGVAIGAEEGLVVPVLRDADRLSFAEISGQIRDFATRSQEGTLSLEDLRGGTFTITNGGVFGSMLSTPILNPPQVGILGMHNIVDRPVAVDGQVEIRPVMYLALSYDHRIVDGREAVQFLVRVKELVEDPEALLLEG